MRVTKIMDEQLLQVRVVVREWEMVDGRYGVENAAESKTSLRAGVPEDD